MGEDAGLFDAFVAGVAPDARERWARDPGARAAMVSLWEAARAPWPELRTTAARFAAELGRRLATDTTLDDLARLHAADLYLAIACADGDQAAIACFEASQLGEVELAASRLRATADQAAEVRSHLRRILFVSEPGRPASTSSYAGRGPLRAYVRVIATRELIRAINRGRREVPLADHEVLDRLDTANDPELNTLRARYHDEVNLALAAALTELDDRARAILRYHLVDGLNLEEVGRLYGVHRATALRWLQGARAALGERIRDALARRLQVDPDEVDSIVRLVQSRVEVSIERLLGAAPSEGV